MSLPEGPRLGRCCCSSRSSKSTMALRSRQPRFVCLDRVVRHQSGSEARPVRLPQALPHALPLPVATDRADGTARLAPTAGVLTDRSTGEREGPRVIKPPGHRRPSVRAGIVRHVATHVVDSGSSRGRRIQRVPLTRSEARRTRRSTPQTADPYHGSRDRGQWDCARVPSGVADASRHYGGEADRAPAAHGVQGMPVGVSRYHRSSAPVSRSATLGAVS